MDRCALCPRVNACIPPHGPQERGGLLFCGEAPGLTENQHALKAPPGLPFIGKTGQEVDRHYLPLAGLKRATVTFTNAIACLPISAGGKLDPNRAGDVALLQSCAERHLYPLLDRMRPRVVVPLGNFACRAVFREPFDLELKHGIPADCEWGAAFPSFHPALGLHEPKKMLYIRTDWHRFRKYLNGTLLLPEDAYPEPDYAEVTDADEIDALDPDQPLACDTESSRDGPFCLTYSQAAGTGRLILATRTDVLDALQQKLNGWRSPILFHNWLYDWAVTEGLSLTFPLHRIVDTMVRVYQLGNLPQGLKALAFRELGMEMQDFSDLVTPYSTQQVLEYYRMAYAEEWEKPEPQLVRDEAGKWKLYKPQSMSTKLKRFFTDYQKNSDKDVFKMWTDNWGDQQAAMVARLGPWPGMDIRHAPYELVRAYACRDSDALIRLWPVLRKMATLTRRFSQEHWREKAA